jgi:hypothetical protein
MKLVGFNCGSYSAWKRAIGFGAGNRRYFQGRSRAEWARISSMGQLLGRLRLRAVQKPKIETE